jgi:hypothetical protein
MTFLKVTVLAALAFVVLGNGARADEHWVSVAGALWRVQGNAHVAIGYSGVRGSEARARADAIGACRDAGGQGCEALAAYDSGCMYIASGHSGERAGYGGGGTPEQALSKCRGQDLECSKPIGGCAD